MDSAVPCSICNEGGHKASDCPCLYDALKEGFYSGGGGGGSHSHDEEDATDQSNRMPRIS